MHMQWREGVVKPGLLRRTRRFGREHPLTAGVLLLVLAMTPLRGAWGWHAARRLDKQLSAYRAQGEPATWDELPFVPVPDAENIYFVQRKAAEAIVVDPPSYVMSQPAPSRPPYGAEWDHIVANSEQFNQLAFELTRRSRQLTRTRFYATRQQPAEQPIDRTDLFFRLGEVLVDGAMLKHFAGEEVEAIERLRDARHVATTLFKMDSVQGYWYGISQSLDIDQRLQILAPRLNLKSPRVSQEVQKLVTELADEHLYQDGLIESLGRSRIADADHQRLLLKGSFWLTPLLDRSDAIRNDQTNTLVAAARETTLSGSKAKLNEHPVSLNYSSGEVRQLRGPATPRYSWMFTPAFLGHGLFGQRAVAEGEQRLTRIILALQLFHEDQHRWPTVLQELVPGYLPGLPDDPFHPGTPMGYLIVKGGLPDGSDRPLVYHDAGSKPTTTISVEPMYGWQSGSGFGAANARQYRDVARWPETVLPSTQPATSSTTVPDPSGQKAVDREPSVPEAPRKEEEK